MAGTTGSEIRVFSGGAPQEVLESLKPLFEAKYTYRVVQDFEHVSVVEKWLAEGRQADVVLLPKPLMGRIESSLGWLPNSRKTLGRVSIGVIVQEGAVSPDISNVEKLKDALLAAQAIAVPKADGLTGSHLMKVMSRLGIADEVSSKLRHKAAIYGAGSLVASGEANIGLYLASEVKAVPGAKLVGLLPDVLQNYIVYEAAVPLKSPNPRPAMDYIEFLSDFQNRNVWLEAGFSTN